MPSPVGHALGGIAIGWPLLPRRTRNAALFLAGIAIAPDLDLLIGTHRGASHSVGAAMIAGLAAAALTPLLPGGTASTAARLRLLAAATLAWTSHVLLDWLSNDTRPPFGVMALWPFTQDYFKASIEIFPPVSRRYWQSRFWLYNLRALVAEVIILAPVAAAVVWLAQRPLIRPDVRKRR